MFHTTSNAWLGKQFESVPKRAITLNGHEKHYLIYIFFNSKILSILIGSGTRYWANECLFTQKENLILPFSLRLLIYAVRNNSFMVIIHYNFNILFFSLTGIYEIFVWLTCYASNGNFYLIDSNHFIRHA